MPRLKLLPYRGESLTGRVFGRLEVTGYAGKNKFGISFWHCVCRKEGNKTVVERGKLVAGKTVSCGCFGRELCGKHLKKILTIHGDSGSPEHKAWMQMIDRCKDAKRADWMNYGGRGIRVCDRWKTYTNFLKDMGRKPIPWLTLGRRDNNGNYEPSNCRWETTAQQNVNKSSTVNLTFKGKTQCLAHWARELNMSKSTIRNRLKLGWPVDLALTSKPRRTHCRV